MSKQVVSLAPPVLAEEGWYQRKSFVTGEK